MDNDAFQEVLGSDSWLQRSSQESQQSLTSAAARLSIPQTDGEHVAAAQTLPQEHTRAFPGSLDTVVSTSRDPRAVHEAPERPIAAPTISRSVDNSAMHQIEAVFERMADSMLQEKDEITIELKSTGRHCDTVRSLSFPGKSAKEAWQFTVVVRILELMHEALRSDTVLSKRDIFYRDPALFGTQTLVDRRVDDIALTFGLPRSSLSVTAAAKGLLAGAMTFQRKDGSSIDAAVDREGLIVPGTRDLLSVDMRSVKWILVVEKEASFRSILASSFWEAISTQGVVLTGKGYPDLASRQLLRFMSEPSDRNDYCSPPVYGLADFDPDGLAILSVYKYGSQKLSHENVDITVPRLQWLGLRSQHIEPSAHSVHASHGFLPLTFRDRRKAARMLEREIFIDDSRQRGSIAELQTMLVLNMKAELQLLDHSPCGLLDLLTSILVD